MQNIFLYLCHCFLITSCIHCQSSPCNCSNSESRCDKKVHVEEKNADILPKRSQPIIQRVDGPQCPAGWKVQQDTTDANRLPYTFPAFPWKVQTIYKMRARITAQPVRLAPNRWVIADHKGRVRVIEIVKNTKMKLREVWKIQLPDVVWSAPTITEDGQMWVGCDDDFVYRINASTGAIIGQVKPFECVYTLKNNPEATRCDMDSGFVALREGGVLAGGAGLVKLNADGQVAWRYGVHTHVRGKPVVDVTGHLYFTTLGGEIGSLDMTGTVRWKEQAPARCDSSPLLTGNCLMIVGCDDRTLNAFSTIDGHPVWKLYVPGEFRGTGALSPDGSVVYWGALDRYLYAVETATGKVRWRYRTSGRHINAPWVDRVGNILVFPEENRGYLLSAEGNLLGTLEVPAIVDAPLSFVDENTVLLGLETGDVLLMTGAIQ